MAQSDSQQPGKNFEVFSESEIVFFDGKESRVISEYERTIIIEFVDFPFPGEEEEFPYERIVVKKDEVTRAS